MRIRPTKDQIEEAAYYRWINMGSPCLDEAGQKANWMAAEQELLKANGINYRVLLETDKLEIRKYNPSKRVIRAANKDYYLQFPYMIFAIRHHEKSSFLYVAFAKE